MVDRISAADIVRPKLPAEALFGLPGKVVRALEPTTEYQYLPVMRDRRHLNHCCHVVPRLGMT